MGGTSLQIAYQQKTLDDDCCKRFLLQIGPVVKLVTAKRLAMVTKIKVRYMLNVISTDRQ